MLPPLHYLDRYRNEETRTYSRHSDYSEAAAIYQPAKGTPTFTLKTYLLANDTLRVWTANPPPELAEHYLRGSSSLFCVHPQVVQKLGDDPYLISVRKDGHEQPGIAVSPSSSTRTLYAGNPIFHAIKTHFPFRISRYGRKMRGEVIEQAINVSRDLETAIDHFDGSFAFLRETIGVAHIEREPASSRGEGWGYLIRDMRPFPPVQEQRQLVPGFALYGRDYFRPDEPPLLFLLIGKKDPLTTILDEIMLPIVRHWLQCFISLGYLLEPHGQNVLLEIGFEDGNYTVTRIVHRDLSLGIDMRQREDKGLGSNHLNGYNRLYSGDFNSIAYDMFMGSHFFERIIECCQIRFPELEAEAFRRPCRDLFAEMIGNSRQYFPNTIRYFSEERDQFNKPLFMDTGQKPLWRPL